MSSCKSPTCFADDLFLLATANVESVAVLKSALVEFGDTGLHPNFQKSSLFIAGVAESDRITSVLLWG